MEQFCIKIHGNFSRVGIGFLVMQLAYKFGIKGFVHKENAHTYKIIVQAPESEAKRFIEKLQSGYLGSKINTLEYNQEKTTNKYLNFDSI